VSPPATRTHVGPSRRDEDPLDVSPGFADAASVLDQADERIDEPGAASARDRHPAGLDREGDHLGHKAGRGRVRAEAGVEHPGREQAVRPLRVERLDQPVPARLDELAAERGEAAPAEAPVRLECERRAGARPELRAEDAERELRLGAEAVDRRPPRVAVAGGVSLELGRIAVSARRQERALSVRVERPRRVLRVEVLETALCELLAEQRMGRTPDPEWMPGAEDVVPEARLGQLGRFDRAAELCLAFEHADAPAGAEEEGCAGERVDPAADDDCVVVSHGRAPGTRRR